MLTRTRLVGSALLLVLSIYLPNWINHAIGRATIDVSQLVQWADSTPLNNDCIVDGTANACEDVKIHFASHTAFLACGDPAGRTKFYPGAGRHDTKGRKDFREKLFKYDIKSKKTTELVIEGLEGDFVTHGLDIYDVPGDEPTVSMCRPGKWTLLMQDLRSISWRCDMLVERRPSQSSLIHSARMS